MNTAKTEVKKKKKKKKRPILTEEGEGQHAVFCVSNPLLDFLREIQLYSIMRGFHLNSGYMVVCHGTAYGTDTLPLPLTTRIDSKKNITGVTKREMFSKSHDSRN